MKKKLYRVETNNIDTTKIYDSYENRYGLKLDFRKYIHFLNVYVSVMKQINISVDFLVLVNNNIYNFGNKYINQITNAIFNENYIDIAKITRIDKHKGQKLEIKYLNTFIQNFDEDKPFIFFDNGTYLWEYLIEMVRMNFFQGKPNRLDSKFFFTNIESCKYYNKTQLNNKGKIYEIEIIEQKSYFEGDMKFMDNFDNQILFLDLINEFNDYWESKTTKEPIIEVIFQGKYKYKNIT